MFTKLLRPLVKMWRAQGLPVVLYLDDGIVTCHSKESCAAAAKIVNRDLCQAGFFVSEPKCVWCPTPRLEWLGIIWDLQTFTMEVTPSRVSKCLNEIDDLINKYRKVTARTLASVVGKIISMGLILGTAAQLYTRYAYFDIIGRHKRDAPLCLSQETKKELTFWKNNLPRLSVTSVRSEIKGKMLAFSDASQFGAGAFVNINDTEHIAVCNWSQKERKTSSMYRELKAVLFAVKAFTPLLRKKPCVQWNTDNKAVASIIPKGSSKLTLHILALEIQNICFTENIILKTQWIPRKLNERADFLSRIIDRDDWSISEEFFDFVSGLFGPFDVDRFADNKNTKSEIFNSRFWTPNTQGIDRCF